MWERVNDVECMSVRLLLMREHTRTHLAPVDIVWVIISSELEPRCLQFIAITTCTKTHNTQLKKDSSRNKHRGRERQNTPPAHTHIHTT